jgi:transcriptional regulator with XRE-family HTH domain
MPDPGNVGDRVRNLRLTKRLSQAQLAGHDLSDSYISLIESGKRTPTPAVLRLLADRLGCTAEFLADGIEPQQRTHLEVHGRHADLARLSGDLETALAGFNHVIARSDNPKLTARARWGQARTLEELGRTEEAILAFEDLREAAEHDTGQASPLPPLVALTRCYHSVGDLGQAVALGERTLERLGELDLTVGEEHTELCRVLLLAYIDRGDVTHAQKLGRAALADAEPTNASVTEAYHQASLRALELGAPGDALYLADQALVSQTKSAWPRARARLRSAAARALLRGVPSFLPRSADSRVFSATGSEPGKDQAREALELLGSAAPWLDGIEAVQCTIESARAHVRSGDLDTAVTTLEQVLRDLDAGAPADERPHAGQAVALERARANLVLAQAWLSKDDLKTARSVLSTVTTGLENVTPGRPSAQAYRELGDLLEAAGDESSAAIAYRRALEAAGLHPAVRSITIAMAGR